MMNFLRWLLSGLVGFTIGAILLGAVLLMVFIGPALAIIMGVGVFLVMLVIGIKEFLDDSANAKKRRKEFQDLEQ